MFIVDVVAKACSMLLAVAALQSAVPKVQLRGREWADLRARGYGERTVRAIGGVELAIAVALVSSAFVPQIGIAACVLFVCVLMWFVGLHVTFGDYANPDTRSLALVPLGYLGLAVVTLVLAIVASA